MKKKFSLALLLILISSNSWGAPAGNYPLKTVPVVADKVVTVDSQDGNKLKNVPMQNLPISDAVQTALNEGINLIFGEGVDITNNGTGEETVSVNMSETTGVIAGKIVTGTSAVNLELTEPQYHGGTVLVTAASIYALPTAEAGLSGCVRAGQGVTVIIQLLPASGDYIVDRGVRGTVGTSIKSSGALGDKICYTAYDANDWYIDTVGTWAE